MIWWPVTFGTVSQFLHLWHEKYRFYYISALSCHTAPVEQNSVGSKTKSIRPRLRPRPKLQDHCKTKTEAGLRPVLSRPRSQTPRVAHYWEFDKIGIANIARHAWVDCVWVKFINWTLGFVAGFALITATALTVLFTGWEAAITINSAKTEISSNEFLANLRAVQSAITATAELLVFYRPRAAGVRQCENVLYLAKPRLGWRQSIVGHGR